MKLEEVERTTNELIFGKASGLDRKRREMIKYLRREGQISWRRILTYQLPQDWEIAIITSTQKRRQNEL